MANLHAAFGCVLLEKIHEVRNCLLEKRDIYINGINRKQLLVSAQCETGVVPWRYLIKAKEIGLFESLKVANIQTDVEMADLQFSSSTDGQENWFDMYQSIPYFSDLEEEDQRFIIQRINEWS